MVILSLPVIEFVQAGCQVVLCHPNTLVHRQRKVLHRGYGDKGNYIGHADFPKLKCYIIFMLVKFIISISAIA